MPLNKKSLLHAYQGEATNPFYHSSPKWLCWEAISQARGKGKTILDAWPGRGYTVNLVTIEDGKTTTPPLL